MPWKEARDTGQKAISTGLMRVILGRDREIITDPVNQLLQMLERVILHLMQPLSMQFQVLNSSLSKANAGYLSKV